MVFQDRIVQKVQKADVYEVESLLRDLEEYDTKCERYARIMSLYMDTNTKDTDQIRLNSIYQVDITNFIKISIDFKKKTLQFIYIHIGVL